MRPERPGKTGSDAGFDYSPSSVFIGNLHIPQDTTPTRGRRNVAW